MKLFKHHREDFYKEDPIKARFDNIMDLVWDLSKKDYNRLIKAMDSAYKAYGFVRGIEEPDESVVANTQTQEEASFMITEGEETK